MLKGFEGSLSRLNGESVRVSAGNGYPEPGMASICLEFSGGSRLQAEYWRLTVDGNAGTSSFDHQQRYGLPAPVDSIAELQYRLKDAVVINAHLDEESGDLLFEFAYRIKLQVFNFTGYEVWEIHFPDGTGEYSNYAKEVVLPKFD
jgi:hypothetical protein